MPVLCSALQAGLLYLFNCVWFIFVLYECILVLFTTLPFDFRAIFIVAFFVVIFSLLIYLSIIMVFLHVSPHLSAEASQRAHLPTAVFYFF